MGEGTARAREVLASGAAKAKLGELVKATAEGS
jgi:anthranilate phosphoribosyltransferase